MTDNDHKERIPKYMTAADYAEHRQRSVKHIYQLIKLGLPHVREGREYRVVVASADFWLDNTARPKSVRAAAAEISRRGVTDG